jgi:hypothetical protein
VYEYSEPQPHCGRLLAALAPQYCLLNLFSAYAMKGAIVFVLHVAAALQDKEQCCGPGQSQRDIHLVDQSEGDFNLVGQSEGNTHLAGKSQREIHLVGQSEGDFHLVGQSAGDIYLADQSESDLAETSKMWLRSPAVPLRHKAIVEPCTLGKVRKFISKKMFANFHL